MSERVFLTVEQAVVLLHPGEGEVHVFSAGGTMMIGSCWPRPRILETLKGAGRIELAGPLATAMGHGIGVIDAEGRRWFFETAADALAKAHDAPAKEDDDANRP